MSDATQSLMHLATLDDDLPAAAEQLELYERQRARLMAHAGDSDRCYFADMGDAARTSAEGRMP